MRSITKGREPASLTAHRKTPQCNYANYAHKDKLREALVREQRGLCCYCMMRITAIAAAMKIEHWRCQSRHEHLELSYQNLLAACLGGEGQPLEKQHCDTRKGEQDLKWNPADPDHRIEHRIRYELDGTIASDDAELDAQLNEVLGLNLSVHKNRRKNVLAAILDWWKAEKKRLHTPPPRERLLREREYHARSDTADMVPYDPVAVWWLDQRLARTAG